jgi:hypothetical protein
MEVLILSKELNNYIVKPFIWGMITSEPVHSVTLCLMRIGSTIVYAAYVQGSME